MLTLLKQARAFGLGMVLATQNPVDLDYKGLSNCGTWFLGRLQTERDKLRVLDGLEGANSGAFDRAGMERTLSSLAPRRFVLHSVYAPAAVTFETRWTMSYLRGPVTREEIKRLAGRPPAAPNAVPADAPPALTPAPMDARPARPPPSPTPAAARPPLPVDLAEAFIGQGGAYLPHALVVSRVHYVDAKAKVDGWVDLVLAAPPGADGPGWARASEVDRAWLRDAPASGTSFEAPPPTWLRKGAAALLSRSFSAWVYQSRAVTLARCVATQTVAGLGEEPGVFRARVALAAREARDAGIAAIQARYAARMSAQADRVSKAQARLEKEKADATAANLDTVATWGGAIFGAIFGGGSAVSKVTRAARTTNRNLGAHDDVTAAREALATAKTEHARLAAELDREVGDLAARLSPDNLVFDTVEVRARKADTDVRGVTLLWIASDPART